MAKKQLNVDPAGSNVSALWKSFSRLKAYRDLSESLATPLGARKRCAYCSDSRAADVDHYRPKSAYPSEAFVFENFILICPECNRRKWKQFPTDDAGIPQLVNPYLDDPWDVFHFVPVTGFLDSRIVAVQKGKAVRDSRGEATLQVLGEILNSEPLLKGRRDSWTRLTQHLKDVLCGDREMPTSRSELWRNDDEFGLGDFILDREGKEAPDVLAWRTAAVAQWIAVRALAA